MTDITDEMAERALITYYPGLVSTDLDALDRVKDAIAAALAAAPSVDRLLAYFPGQTADSDEAWACWAIANLAPSDESGWVATLPRDCRALECPGPHRSLLLGPEVTA